MIKQTYIIVGAIAILIIGFNFVYKNKPNKTTNSVNQERTDEKVSAKLVSPSEFAKLIKQKDSFVLDVHTPEQTHIPGTDAFIPDTKISENIDKLPKDKTKPILVYCRSGSMSARVAKELISLGYTNVYDLKGGTNAYKEQQVSVAITPESIPLGTVVYGDVPTTKFTLTNYTPLPLKITRVSTSCGCTSAKVENEEVRPYGTTTINVSFDPAVHKDDTDMGELTRTIYIETDNPNFPELESTITANVVKK